MRLKLLPALALALCLLLGGAPEALAKSRKELTYRFPQVWSAAVRLLRADQGYRVTDKDKETGYILFVYPGKGTVKACQASMEVVPFVDRRERTRRIRVQLHIAHQPSYVELHLLDLLERKLKEEQGDPPPPEKLPEKKPKKDKDKDKKKPDTGNSGWQSGEGEE